ncbi:GNAT family acetyltransferase [Clostridium sulfidigenes]|uniref:GNAT family acetyltransferase n=1 Tax=Clostridium sulfidigenes TaxID=318464 RepID=A0A084J830_9CLOT|nr:GNAT family acetyltransferase [Clostridium sulfidigenes]
MSNATDEANKYIIRDSSGIIVGRFIILDLDHENKGVIIKLKFYKSGRDANKTLQDALKLMLNNLIKSKGLHKVNIICDEKISLTPFTNLGFQLEGYISDSIITKFKYEGSLLFGIVEEEFYNNSYKKELAIQGNKISIRVLNSDDASDLLEYYTRNKEFLSKFEPHRDEEFYTVEVQKQSLIENYKEFIKGEGAHFGIYKAEKMIGRIRIYNIVHGVFKSAFIGYSMDEQYQGNGYMKEAVSLVVTYAYEELGLHRIEATTLVDNEKSQRVLKACGFNELGICKEYLHINGKWRDHVIFYKNNK